MWIYHALLKDPKARLVVTLEETRAKSSSGLLRAVRDGLKFLADEWIEKANPEFRLYASLKHEILYSPSVDGKELVITRRSKEEKITPHVSSHYVVKEVEAWVDDHTRMDYFPPKEMFYLTQRDKDEIKLLMETAKEKYKDKYPNWDWGIEGDSFVYGQKDPK